MKKDISLIVIVLFIVFSICLSKKAIYANDELIYIKSGVSFGECTGYCITEIQLTNQNIVFEQSAWDNSLPVKQKARVIKEDEWMQIVSLIDIDYLLKLKDVYGYPDSHDQGAEWIEIKTSSFTKRIEFDAVYLSPLLSNIEDLLPINELIIRLREIRKDFKK